MNKDHHTVANIGTKPRFFNDFQPGSYSDWKNEANKALKGAPFEKKLISPTPEGISLKPIYTSDDVADLPEIASMPGFPPFLRGPDVWRDESSAWHVAHDYRYPTGDDTNSAIMHDLANGLSSVVLTLDEPTRRGVDPDQTDRADVGRHGLSISSADELRDTIKGIDLASIPIVIDCGTSGIAFLGYLIAVAQPQGVPTERLSGAVAMDPVGELARLGSLPASLDRLLDELADMTTWAKKNAPGLGTIWIHGEVFSDGGAHAVQELAYSLATGVFYLRSMEQRGCDANVSVRHTRFSFSLGTSFFMEIAKIRAARLLWHRVCEACGIPQAKRAMRIHGRTSRYTMTTWDPYINMLRGTTETLAAALAGVDTIEVTPFDEAVRTPGEFSRRVARNTQLVIRDEVHAGKVLDPAGGSWYVERLTAELAARAWSLFQDIEREGGVLECLRNESIQNAILKTNEHRQSDAANRRRAIVGINQYPNAAEKKLDSAVGDFAALQQRRMDEVKAHKASATNSEKTAALKRLSSLTDTDHGTLTTLSMEAASAGATCGEITQALPARRPAQVDALKVKRVIPGKLSDGFEKLRDAVTAARASGINTRVFLATVGKIAAYMPRFDFSATFFETGGFEVVRTLGFDSPDSAAEAAVTSGAALVLICAPDESYPVAAPAITHYVKECNADTIVVLAGLPDDDLRARLENSGVDEFIHARANVLETLTSIADRLGVER